jgi:hypothetical protein
MVLLAPALSMYRQFDSVGLMPVNSTGVLHRYLLRSRAGLIPPGDPSPRFVIAGSIYVVAR